MQYCRHDEICAGVCKNLVSRYNHVNDVTQAVKGLYDKLALLMKYAAKPVDGPAEDKLHGTGVFDYEIRRAIIYDICGGYGYWT